MTATWNGHPQTSSRSRFPPTPTRRPDQLAIEAPAPAPLENVISVCDPVVSEIKSEADFYRSCDARDDSDGDNQNENYEGSEAVAEGIRRSTRCRRATQLYGEPLPNDIV